MKTGKEGVGEEAAGAASLPPRTAQSFVGKRLGGGARMTGGGFG